MNNRLIKLTFFINFHMEIGINNTEEYFFYNKIPTWYKNIYENFILTYIDFIDLQFVLKEDELI